MQKKDIPNVLSVARLFLAGVFFVVLMAYQYVPPGLGSSDIGSHNTWALLVGAGLFIIAAATDALDGHLARKWQVISVFGRIVDPLADKILVLGAFIMLAGANFADPAKLAANEWFYMVSGVYPWMVVVILLRELLVTTLRGTLEGMGVDFSAQKLGKWKMIFQSAVVPIVLIVVWIDPLRQGWPWLAWLGDLLVWATVLVTVLSGWPYVTGAAKVLKK